MELLILALLLGTAAAFSGDEKIVGGYECSPHGVPWQVSLNIGYHSCGASIISDQWLVSAAHCYMVAALGDPDWAVFEGTEQLIKIDNIFWHDKYDYYTLDHDIMLIKLNVPCIFNDYIQPVRLPTNCAADGTMCTVSGYGNLLGSGSQYPDSLHCVDVPIVSAAECDAAYPGLITSTMVCAGYLEGGKDACQGDSGGPLVCDGVLQGIVSWGYGCAEQNHPGVYTKVCSLLDWIYETMANN
ncbi:trypsin-like isoform X2 [Hemiscyllium ocellatum]|uniref:trypsin-like isoform X2 n=1 Tax=Hemiscyllium ocellatum TaxID=170820 RepID=UPI002966AD04|nr:trypsin-like isoform X2 [Hemiscyllium ocellatum]